MTPTMSAAPERSRFTHAVAPAAPAASSWSANLKLSRGQRAIGTVIKGGPSSEPHLSALNCGFDVWLRCGTNKGVSAGRHPRSAVKWADRREHYLAGLETTSLGVWSWVMRVSILDTNFGVWSCSICRMPGPNSRKAFIPTSLPIVEPKLLNVAEVDRAQNGR